MDSVVGCLMVLLAMYNIHFIRHQDTMHPKQGLKGNKRKYRRQNRSKSTKKYKHITFLVCPDIEGKLSHLYTWVKANPGVEIRDGVLSIKQNTMVVFAGDLAPDKVSSVAELNDYTKILNSIIKNPQTVIVAGNRDINKIRLLYEVDFLLNNPQFPFAKIPTMKDMEFLKRYTSLSDYIEKKDKKDINAMTVLEFLLYETMGCSPDTAKMHFDAQKLRSGIDQQSCDYDAIWKDLYSHWFSTTGLYTTLLRKSNAMFYDEHTGMLVVHGNAVQIRQKMKLHKEKDSWCYCFETMADNLALRDVCKTQNKMHANAVSDATTLTTENQNFDILPEDEILTSLCYLAFMAGSSSSFIYGSNQIYGRIDYEKVNQKEVKEFFAWFKHQGGKLCIHAHQPIGMIPSHCVISNVIVIHIDTSALLPIEWSLKCDQEKVELKATLNYGCVLKFCANLQDHLKDTVFEPDGKAYCICDDKHYKVGDEYLGVVTFYNMPVGKLYKSGLLGDTRRKEDYSVFVQKYIFKSLFESVRLACDALVFP